AAARTIVLGRGRASRRRADGSRRGAAVERSVRRRSVGRRRHGDDRRPGVHDPRHCARHVRFPGSIEARGRVAADREHADRRAVRVGARRALRPHDRAAEVRQLLLESVAGWIVAGSVGVLPSLWGLAAVVAARPVDTPRLHDGGIDRSVLWFAALLSAVTGIGFGIVPAFQVSRSDAGETLKGTTGGPDPRGGRTRQILVASEVALSLLLLAGAGLLGRTVVNLERVDVGFVTERTLAMEVSLPDTRYSTDAARIAFYRRTIEALRSV